MDVVSWLRGLGLEQYAPAFLDDDVDGEARLGTGNEFSKNGAVGTPATLTRIDLNPTPVKEHPRKRQ